MLSLTPAARAHRLDGEYRVLPGGKVQIESWFETGDAPKGAKVTVYRADGSPLLAAPGELDDRGIYVFTYKKAEPLRVVIAAGQGHRKELTIATADLAARDAPPRERSYEFPVQGLAAGVALLLALGAFLLILRQGRELAALRRRLDALAGERDGLGAERPSAAHGLRPPHPEGIREARP